MNDKSIQAARTLATIFTEGQKIWSVAKALDPTGLLLTGAKHLFEVLTEVLLSDGQQRSIDDLRTGYDKACEALVLEGIQEGLVFVSGRFKIALLPASAGAEKVEVSADVYFQDKASKWTVKNSRSVLATNALTPEAIDELKRTPKIEFEIEEPAYTAEATVPRTPATDHTIPNV